MILVCYGTRPEWIKVKPIIDTLDCKVLFTGQHIHLADYTADYKLNIDEKKASSRLNSIISSVLSQDKIFKGVKSVLVQGDTASTFAIALAAYNKGIGVIHLEAGLRTYDLSNPYPEEAYRQMVSRIANIHLCPTEKNKKYLVEEKVSGDLYVVGNTVLDNLIDLPISYNKEILVTMHRRENHSFLKEWFIKISKLAEANPDLVFTLPIHPNPNVLKNKKYLNNINIVDPIPYGEMKKRIASCRFLISDSGGLQEEASFLRKKIIVCRKTTEREESLGVSSFLCKKPDNLESIFLKIKNDYIIKEGTRCPYGDGYSALKIKNIIEGNI